VFADENETSVDSGSTSQEPAKTAEIESAGAPAPSSPGAAIGAPQETPVSPLTAEQVAMMIEEQVSTARAEMEDVRATLRAYIDESIMDVKGILPVMIAGIIGESRKPVPITNAMTGAPEKIVAGQVHALAVGDPVRVYKDAERKTFYTGAVTALHEGGHAADVSINELEGALTTARLDSLEYDDRA
jgi:hypothetical protein